MCMFTALGKRIKVGANVQSPCQWQGLLRKRCRSGPLHPRMTNTDQRSSLHLPTPLIAIPTRMKTHRDPQRKRQQAWSRLLPLDGSRPLACVV